MTSDPARPSANPQARPSAAEARAALDAASSIKVVSDRDLRVLQRVLVGVGAAMSVLLLLIRGIGDDTWGLFLAMGLYAIGLVVLLRWQKTVQAAPRGYGVRYGLGIAGTSAFYGLGCALIPGAHLTWATTAILALFTLTPALVAARSIGRLGTTR